jgi:hypothetical protein
MLNDYDKPILNKEGKPLKIAMLADHHCIRVQKQAKALKSLGYEVWGNGTKVSYGMNTYDQYLVYDGEAQFKNNVKLMVSNGCNILHFHNEPSHPVKWIREVVQDMTASDRVKIVADLHDLDTIRQGFASVAELEMMANADGLIYVSQPIQEIINRLFKVNIPNTVVYSYCNKDIVSFDESKIFDRKGLVYEGGLNPPDDIDLNRRFSYRDLYGIMKRLVEMGNETHIFCGNMSAYTTYQNIGAVICPPTIYNEMMEKLTKFKYGICIFNKEDGQKAQVKYTLSNKEEEYLQAGLPSLACWCPETMEHIKKHGIGFVFNHIDEVGDCSQLENQYLDIMKNIKTKRQELVMENFIIKTENLYAELLGLEKKGMPDNIKNIHLFEYGEKDVYNTLK